MAESNPNVIEAEIAELSRQIEEKRSQLEREAGIVEERGLIKEAISPHFEQSSPAPVANPAVTSLSPAGKTPVNYLQSLDPDTVAQINSLIAAVPVQGYKKVISTVKEDHPYLIDVFHDALVTVLYDELKARGIVK